MPALALNSSGWGSRQAGFAEAAGHRRGHQAAEREGARAVAGQALYGLRGAALLACSGHGAPWGLRDRAEGCGQQRGSAGGAPRGTHPTRGTQGAPLLPAWWAGAGHQGPGHKAVMEGAIGVCDGPSDTPVPGLTPGPANPESLPRAW